MIVDDEEYKFIVNGKDYHCSLDITMSFIGGKWKAVVLWYLRKGKKRFTELKAHVPDITDKMLSLQLKALESDGIVERKLYPEVPPRVEYQLTEEGKTLIPVIEAIAQWGRTKAEKEGEMVRVK
ncbi:MAG: helix-turn-helix domain-containing protein [Bacteroidota bacterium]